MSPGCCPAMTATCCIFWSGVSVVLWGPGWWSHTYKEPDKRRENIQLEPLQGEEGFWKHFPYPGTQISLPAKQSAAEAGQKQENRLCCPLLAQHHVHPLSRPAERGLRRGWWEWQCRSWGLEGRTCPADFEKMWEGLVRPERENNRGCTWIIIITVPLAVCPSKHRWSRQYIVVKYAIPPKICLVYYGLKYHVSHTI